MSENQCKSCATKDAIIREMGKMIKRYHGIIPQQVWEEILTRPDVAEIIDAGKVKGSQIQDVVMCKCEKNPASDPHPCPYQSEINGDDEFECTCCPDCEDECADDI